MNDFWTVRIERDFFVEYGGEYGCQYTLWQNVDYHFSSRVNASMFLEIFLEKYVYGKGVKVHNDYSEDNKFTFSIQGFDYTITIMHRLLDTPIYLIGNDDLKSFDESNYWGMD